MSKKESMTDEYKLQRAELEVPKFSLKTVNFVKDTPIFLNYVNKVTHQEFELRIKDNLLIIKNTQTQKTCLVPLTNVASMDLL